MRYSITKCGGAQKKEFVAESSEGSMIEEWTGVPRESGATASARLGDSMARRNLTAERTARILSRSPSLCRILRYGLARLYFVGRCLRCDQVRNGSIVVAIWPTSESREPKATRLDRSVSQPQFGTGNTDSNAGAWNGGIVHYQVFEEILTDEEQDRCLHVPGSVRKAIRLWLPLTHAAW
jgi:hypothetical protein